jgi:hypothetical protein
MYNNSIFLKHPHWASTPHQCVCSFFVLLKGFRFQFYMVVWQYRELFQHDSFFECVLEWVVPRHLAVLVWRLLSRKSRNTMLWLKINCKVCLKGCIRILNNCLIRLGVDWEWFRAQFNIKISTSVGFMIFFRAFMVIAVVQFRLLSWETTWLRTWSIVLFWLIHACWIFFAWFFICWRVATTTAI